MSIFDAAEVAFPYRQVFEKLAELHPAKFHSWAKIANPLIFKVKNEP